MKTKISLILLGFVFINSPVFAQKPEKKEKVKIRVEKIVNGKKEIIEKEIDASELTNENREIMIEESVDSLIGNANKKKHIKVTIDNQGNVNREERFSIDEDQNFEGPKTRKQYHRNFDDEFEDFSSRMKSLGEEIPKRIEKFHYWDVPGMNAENGSPIRSLNVYPNRPETEVVNVKFYAPNEGDVSIVVTDIKGNVVAKTETKNFKGEYVGQIRLSKKSTGTYFVMVSQGDDGLCRRLVI